MSEVYKLNPMLDTPGYASFGIEDDSALDSDTTLIGAFLPTDCRTREWKARTLSPLWHPRTVVDPLPHQVNDYPCIALVIPTFSERAVSALREFLEPNGELLPVKHPTGRYFAFNVTTVADVLDREQSQIEWPLVYRLKKMEPILADDITHYEFRAEGIASLSIFRIPEDLTGYYVTDRFAARVGDRNLRGFNLKKVWPLPKRRETGGFAKIDRLAGG